VQYPNYPLLGGTMAVQYPNYPLLGGTMVVQYPNYPLLGGTMQCSIKSTTAGAAIDDAVLKTTHYRTQAGMIYEQISIRMGSDGTASQ